MTRVQCLRWKSREQDPMVGQITTDNPVKWFPDMDQPSLNAEQPWVSSGFLQGLSSPRLAALAKAAANLSANGLAELEYALRLAILREQLRRQEACTKQHNCGGDTK